MISGPPPNESKQSARGRRGSGTAHVGDELACQCDLLFVLARVANDDGRGDVLWEPGASSGGASE